MTRSKQTGAVGRARHRPRHATPSLLAPSRSLPAVLALLVLTALGIAGCAAVAGSDPVSSRPRAGGPSIPHIALDRAVAVDRAIAAEGIATGVTGTWFTGGGAAGASGSTAPGAVAAAVDPTAPSALAGSGLPGTALTAYKLAAAREATRRPACGIVWPLLAGIGRVESNHGRFAGAVLHTDGYSTPRIVGIPLNGNGTALIRDTDRGRLDGDTVYDRAVGPMQFIPSTWAGWGVDANHDGRTDPNNLFDAAAAAADYLCAAGRNLRTYAGQVQAVRSYNNSDAYIAMVLGLEREYASGVVGVTIPVLPSDPDPGTVRPPHPPKLPPVDPGTPRGVPAKPKPKPKPVPGATSSTPAPSPTTSSAPPTAPATPSAPDGGTTSTDPGSGTPSTDAPSTDPPTSPAPSCDPSSSTPPADPSSSAPSAASPADPATTGGASAACASSATVAGTTTAGTTTAGDGTVSSSSAAAEGPTPAAVTSS